MDRALRITGSSYLLPNHRAWSVLRPYGQISFGEYGDWAGTLISGKPEQELIWVLFLEDVLDPASVATAAASSDQLFAPILAPLRVRLQSPSAAIIVAYSARRAESPIRSARQFSPWRRVAEAFEKTLYELAQAHPALFLLDMDDLFAGVGRDACFDARNFYVAHCRLSAQGAKVLAEGIAQLLERRSKPAKKVLVLDCDNTLWGGVVGEGGLAGLTLGQDGLGAAFVDFQRKILKFAGEGVLLAIASKNNAAEVLSIFDEHPSMLLKRCHIAAWRVDWNDKAANILELAQELDLSPDSFVFWDDDNLERERMRAQLPQVSTPELPDDVILWPSYLARMPDFARFTVTEEDQKKTDQYRARFEFILEKKNTLDEKGFLRSIELRPEAITLGPATVSRAAQLCSKTNQFNLRTQRHTESNLVEIAAGPGAFVVRLTDRFGDHGIVGFVALRSTTDLRVTFLDTFLISCRVLGRHLEAWMLDRSVQAARQSGAEWLVAEFVPTDRNFIAKEFLSSHGLRLITNIDASEREQLESAVNRIAAGGQLYAEKVDDIRIPFVEAFANDANATHETA